MKGMIKFYIIAILFLIGCKTKMTQQNHFSSNADTIIIKMEQFSGKGFTEKSRGIHELKFSDSLDYDVILPENVDSIQLASETIDYNIMGYKRTMAEPNVPKPTPYYQKLIENNKIDTANLPTQRENSVCFLKGKFNGKDVFIVDENFNKDFRDDSIRYEKLVDFQSNRDLIKCNFKTYNGKQYDIASNWIQVGKWKLGGDELYYLTNQYYIADFQIEKSSYQLEYFLSDARFNFENPSFGLITYNGVKKDTITDGEILSINDYLRLEEGDYRIHNLSADGNYLTLIKEKGFDKLDGTQIGMLAPDFNCTSMSGDSINVSSYKGRFLLLANVSACYSAKSSYQCYKEITETYREKFEILCLDKSPVFLSNNIKELGLTGKFIDVNKNKSIEAYRPEFCSRTCFLINPDGRIIDKFEIFDWEQSLCKHFERKK